MRLLPLTVECLLPPTLNFFEEGILSRQIAAPVADLHRLWFSAGTGDIDLRRKQTVRSCRRMRVISSFFSTGPPSIGIQERSQVEGVLTRMFACTRVVLTCVHVCRACSCLLVRHVCADMLVHVHADVETYRTVQSRSGEPGEDKGKDGFPGESNKARASRKNAARRK